MSTPTTNTTQNASHELALSVRDPPTTNPDPPRPPAATKLPPELWIAVAEYLQTQWDLAQLARVSRFILNSIDRTRFEVSLIHTPSGVASFRAALSNVDFPERGRRVRGLLVFLCESAVWLEGTKDDLAWVVERVTNVDLLELVIGPVWRNHNEALNSTPSGPADLDKTERMTLMPSFSLAGMHILQSLNTASSLLQSIQAPPPSLACLSVLMERSEDISTVLTTISRLFGETLVKLRVIRKFEDEGDFTKGSPVRIVCGLETPRLRYLEIRDDAMVADVGLGVVDMYTMDETLRQPKAGVPALEMLVWTPAWSETEWTHEAEFWATLVGYRWELGKWLEHMVFLVGINSHGVLTFERGSIDDEDTGEIVVDWEGVTYDDEFWMDPT